MYKFQYSCQLSSSPNPDNTAVFIKSGSGYVLRNRSSNPTEENFGSFSISAAVRGPYKQPQSANGNWGCTCSTPENCSCS